MDLYLLVQSDSGPSLEALKYPGKQGQIVVLTLVPLVLAGQGRHSDEFDTSVLNVPGGQ